MKTTLFFQIFLFIFIIGKAQMSDTLLELKCDKGYVLNINGENRCIDTTILFYNPHSEFFIWDSIVYYPSWFYTVAMKIFNEQKWGKKYLTEDKIRVLLFDDECDTLFLLLFSNVNTDTIYMEKKVMKWYNAPLKKPITGKYLMKDSTYLYNFYYGDSIVCTTDKIRMDNLIQDWYTESYGKIDTVTYTTTEYQIPKKSYDKFFKHVVNLKKYNFDTEMLIDIILIEYVINNEYQLNWITKSELMLYRDKFFLKNMTNLLKWLNQFM
jgi:hypothetical protein